MLFLFLFKVNLLILLGKFNEIEFFCKLLNNECKV